MDFSTQGMKKRKDVYMNHDYISVLRDYVSKFELDLRALSDEELLKQHLKKFFLVPKLFDTLKKTELLAAFINLLLNLMYEIDFFNTIHKELRFLLMVLGDAKIFMFEEHGPVQMFLFAEVEGVADVAGSLLHSCIFFEYEDPECDTIEWWFGVLMKRMQLLKGNIFNFLKLHMPLIVKCNGTTNSNAHSSLFIVDSLICDFENLLIQGLTGIVKDQIEVIHRELMLSRSLLKGSIMDSSEIQEHVVSIIQVAYEAEYLINSFVAGDAPLWYFSMRINQVFHKIKLIGTALQEIKNNYDIGALKFAKKNFITSQPQLQDNRNFEVNDDIVIGFEERVVDVLDKMIGGTDQLQIIFIFGMPGLGKTTFAKKLYNHPIVSYRFDTRSWCVVSQMYQRKSLLTVMSSSINQLDKDNIFNIDEESLALKMYQSLKGKRYLIIIDDVWDTNAWNDLQRCLPNDKNGSRILMTSRNTDVAPPNSIMCALPYLSSEQCWELLEKKVFKDKSCPSQLLGVGKEIAANCRGLPLTVVVIVGILSTLDMEESTWKKVGEKVFSYSSCGENDSMMQILELSYKHLPQYLKPCFLYFGILPEDEEILTRKLIQLWVAEGFIPKEDSLKNLELLAEEYLMELIDKSLVMVAERSSRDRVKACIIHDRLRDLCLNISEEEKFLKSVVGNKYSIYEKSYHLVQSQHTCAQSSFGLHVRSFHSHCALKSPFFSANMKLVRVLDFIDVGYNVRLIGVEYLINLRYLVIDGEWLSSIANLVNLDYLRVVNGDKIPFSILKMDKLKYLYFPERGAYFDEDYK